jgi:hypothetical protein
MRAFILFIAVFIASIPALACVNPEGKEGEITYNSTLKMFQGCTYFGWYGFHQAPDLVCGYGDLVAYWNFDETSGATQAADSATGMYPGILTNMDPNTDWVAGQYNNGLDFDGANDYVDTGYNANLEKITVTAWAYARTDGGSDWGRIFDKRETSSEVITLLMGGSADRLVYSRHFSGGQGEWYTPENSFLNGAWYHVAVTHDASSDTNDPLIYINGVSQTLTENQSPSGDVNTNPDDFIIGNRANDLARGFDGIIDEVRIYNRVLSGAEITDLYNAGAGCH